MLYIYIYIDRFKERNWSQGTLVVPRLFQQERYRHEKAPMYTRVPSSFLTSPDSVPSQTHDCINLKPYYSQDNQD
ncbi:MAG: hypothetical protein M3162_09780 [Thermoproteota archaeon]|nr:hypothetical protein [Thermoproteota archaeon]